MCNVGLFYYVCFCLISFQRPDLVIIWFGLMEALKNGLFWALWTSNYMTFNIQRPENRLGVFRRFLYMIEKGRNC